MRYDLRFWAENISPPEVVRHGLPLLREFSAGVCVALFADSMTEENARAFLKIKEAGVELVFWPLLPLEKGYFPGEKNVSEFIELVRELYDWARDGGITPDMIAIDQEIPFGQMTHVLEAGPALQVARALKVAFSNIDRESFLKAREDLRGLNSWIKERGMRSLSACMPWVVLELGGEHELIQDMTETPVGGVGWDIVSPMLYVSMIAGMTSGLVSMRDANWLVYDGCVNLRNSLGGRAGVSLGLTGTGVLGDEPVCCTPDELMVGVEASIAAGITDISIYNLEGILAKEDPRAWFARLRSARPRAPEFSRKIAVGLAAARAVHPPLARLAGRFS